MNKLKKNLSAIKNKKNINGGDGYSVNIEDSIAGLPEYKRYSYNTRPVFNGDLLQNGGDGYVVNVGEAIGGMPAYPRYSNNYRPIFEGELLQNGGGGGGGEGNCGCGSSSIKEPSIFDLIKKQGGGGKGRNRKKPEEITQFHAIRELSYTLEPLPIESLTKLTVDIFLNEFNKIKPIKSKQLGGFSGNLEQIIAPLGKNNLLVLSSLLLLHYFAVEKQSTGKNKFLISGGSNILVTMTNILSPLGINNLGSALVLVGIAQAFKQNKSSKKNTGPNILKSQYGGSPLKNLIAPLGTNAFIATGLLIVLQKLFVNTVNKINLAKKNKVSLKGGNNVNKHYEKLFNLIAPITFNAFATETFLKKMAVNKK
jgi:hypothetical protein